MKETIALENPRFGGVVPDDMRAGLLDTVARIGARSLIVWGEHCSECAAPACYSACSFYTPRADGHCRRFVQGIEVVDGLATSGASATRIQFRQWGKLEGRGPVRAVGVADASDRNTAAAAPKVAFSLPFLARRAAWKQTQADRAHSSGPTANFDAFVVEGYAPQGKDIAFTLTIVPDNKSTLALFQTQFVLSAKWSRHVVAFDAIAKQIDLAQDFLIQIEPVGEASGLEAIFGVVDFVAWAKGKAPVVPAVATAPAPFAKVVVWDLDHTIWDGILLEDGAEGVTLRPGVRAAMDALDARGILQSVASKNNPDEALAALAHHGLSDLMLAPQIGWGPKSEALSHLAQILNLGLDSFVFIDDQPFERGEVGEAHPQVTVLPETAVDGLLDRPQFDVPVTAESKGRRALYAVEAQRVVAAQGAGTDYDAFLRACDLKLTIAPLDSADSERVYELSQRTNQLNVAATRYTREDVAGFIGGTSGAQGWTMRCADRFGDYGLIGFALFDAKEGVLIDFFMSCRVQRKRVEAAFFAWMGAQMAAAGASHMSARWRKAARNGPAVEMFEALGFTLYKESAEAGILTRDDFGGFEGAEIVSIVSLSHQIPSAGNDADPLAKAS
jgi:FkbH-like protein